MGERAEKSWCGKSRALGEETHGHGVLRTPCVSSKRADSTASRREDGEPRCAPRPPQRRVAFAGRIARRLRPRTRHTRTSGNAPNIRNDPRARLCPRRQKGKRFLQNSPGTAHVWPLNGTICDNNDDSGVPRPGGHQFSAWPLWSLCSGSAPDGPAAKRAGGRSGFARGWHTAVFRRRFPNAVRI